MNYRNATGDLAAHETIYHDVSAELFNQVQPYISFWAILIVAIFGFVTNILVAMVFVKQGLKDGVNLSMFAITLWDLLRCLCAILHRLYGPILLISHSFGESWKAFTFPNIEYTMISIRYVSCGLATYVSIERCICVTMPFTVKSIFTPKFTLLMISIISVAMYGAYFVMYLIYSIIWEYNPKFNTSVAKYINSNFYNENGITVMTYYKTISMSVPFICFVILCVCSAITVYVMRKSSMSAQKSKNTFQKDNTTSTTGISNRDKQVVRMLLVVIFVYICNLFPQLVFYGAQVAEPEYYVLRKYNNIFLITAQTMFLLDLINASTGFFIFINMSSKFRVTFYSFLERNKEK